MAISDIQNQMDGVDTKNQEIITILTTNYMDKIIEHGGKALLRPGRLTVVPIPPPDADAASRLVLKYGRGNFHPDADFERMGTALAGKIPSLIQETVELAKIAAIARVNGPKIKGLVMEHDVMVALKQLEWINQRLLDQAKPVERAMYFKVDKEVFGAWGKVDITSEERDQM